MNGDLVEGWKMANRAYELQPDNPEDIAALASTWMLLGDIERAEQLLLKGLETSNQNANLLAAHWMTLMAAHRYEEAEAQVRDLMRQMGENLPAALQREFNFQLGMIALVRGDFREARRLLLSAISEDDQPVYSGDDVMVVTLASLASKQVGAFAEAQGLLESAARIIQRGKLNGVEDSGICYNEAVLLAMNQEPAQALEKLREAYDRGFREKWILDIDGRLASLRDQPEFISLKDRISDDLEQARSEIETLSLAAL